MILLKQGGANFDGYGYLVSKFAETNLKLNENIINDDIIKMQKLLANGAFNKSDKSNIKGIITYLTKLRSKITNGVYQFTWMFEEFRTRAYPFDLRQFEEYKVNAVDYIELDSRSLIKADYSEVFEIIAFEMMYRDLGLTMKEMEDNLAHIGIATVVDSIELTKFIEEPALKLSQVLRIGDCPYASQDGSLAWDYFGLKATCSNNAFTSGKYKDCVGLSINIAISLINKSILENLIDRSDGVDICALNSNGFYYRIKGIDELDIKSIFEPVIVRAFGRKFEVKPKITIF